MASGYHSGQDSSIEYLRKTHTHTYTFDWISNSHLLKIEDYRKAWIRLALLKKLN